MDVLAHKIHQALSVLFFPIWLTGVGTAIVLALRWKGRSPEPARTRNALIARGIAVGSYLVLFGGATIALKLSVSHEFESLEKRQLR
ncbi:MAG: hypothetical protein ACREJ9_12810 [Candidatus Rokuibacteriota bacterium]